MKKKNIFIILWSKYFEGIEGITCIVVMCGVLYFTVSNITLRNKVNNLEELNVLKDSVINLQDSIIQRCTDHCWEGHNCDCPWLDGNEPINIVDLKIRISSLDEDKI